MDFTRYLQIAVSHYRDHDYQRVVEITKEVKLFLRGYPQENPLVLHIDVMYILSSLEVVNEPVEVLHNFYMHLKILGGLFIKTIESYNNVSYFFLF